MLLHHRQLIIEKAIQDYESVLGKASEEAKEIIELCIDQFLDTEKDPLNMPVEIYDDDKRGEQDIANMYGFESLDSESIPCNQTFCNAIAGKFSCKLYNAHEPEHSRCPRYKQNFTPPTITVKNNTHVITLHSTAKQRTHLAITLDRIRTSANAEINTTRRMEKRYSTTKHKSQPSQQITYTAGYYENPNPKKGHYIPCEIHPY